MAERGYNDLEATIDRLKKQKELCQELLKKAGLKIKVLESSCKMLEEKVEFEKKNQEVAKQLASQREEMLTELPGSCPLSNPSLYFPGAAECFQQHVKED